MRITGGDFKGRSLRVPASIGTRPSSGRLKEALFSSLGDSLRGRCVADLFAGSGALGFEALSRGAARAVFVEIDARAIRVIRANLGSLGLDAGRVLLRRADARRWLGKLEAGELPAAERPDILLMDPPYGEDELPRLLPQATRLVESGAVELCVLEHDAAFTPTRPDGSNVQLGTRRHGRGAFSLIERSDA